MAQRIVADHLDANAQLKASAHSRGVDLPLELDAKYRRRLDRLTKLSGDEFDAKYTKMMVVDHKQDILRFKKQAAQGVDADLQQFAAAILPKLHHHLAMAASTALDAAAR